ncbi:MAG: antitoxin [Prevotella sp.]|nr:antitoxin [Prevotella sp.]
MRSLLQLHFVKTGVLTLEEGALVGMLFNLRQSGDYEDFKQVTKEQIDELAPMTALLVDKLKTLI